MSVNSIATLNNLRKNEPAFAAFLETYFSGDELWSIDQDDCLIKSSQEKYFRSKRSLVLKFLGFPAENIMDSEQSASNLLRNMFGWRATRNSSWREIGVNVIFAAPTFIWNIVKIVPRFALNIAKLATEFLPALAINSLENMAEKNRASNRAKFYLAKSVSYALQGVRFITRAVTSPIANIKAAYQRGQELVGAGKIGGKVLGVTLGIVSGLITAATYLILFPIAIKAIAAHVVPHVASQLPAVSSFLQTLAPHLDKVGAAVHTVGSTITSVLSGASATFTGFAALGAAAAVAANVVMDAKNWIMQKWSALTAKRAIEKAPDNIVVKQDSTFKPSTKHAYKYTGLEFKQGQFVEPKTRNILSTSADVIKATNPGTSPQAIVSEEKRKLAEEEKRKLAEEVKRKLAEKAARKLAEEEARKVEVENQKKQAIEDRANSAIERFSSYGSSYGN